MGDSKAHFPRLNNQVPVTDSAASGAKGLSCRTRPRKTITVVTVYRNKDQESQFEGFQALPAEALGLEPADG